MWYPTIQFTCKLFDPKTKETTWKSVNVSNFVTPPPGLDKRSSKADEFSITYKSAPGSDTPESYAIRANLGTDLQVSLEVARPATVPGYKIGKGPKGGYSYFGTDTQKPDGYVIHRFWPRFTASGHVIQNGKASTIQGTGMLVHAIQGMRPNLVASRWNFAHFQSEQHGGVSAIQMEFTTVETYGKRGAGSGGISVNVGSLVIDNQLAAVTAQTHYPGEKSTSSVISKATHLNPVPDSATGYKQPLGLLFEWNAPSLTSSVPGTLDAKIKVDLGDLQNPKGLIEKVDVLAEIPYVIKIAVNYVAGTKPYIYQVRSCSCNLLMWLIFFQWINPATLVINGSGLETGLEVEGHVYNEATFIS